MIAKTNRGGKFPNMKLYLFLHRPKIKRNENNPNQQEVVKHEHVKLMPMSFLIQCMANYIPSCQYSNHRPYHMHMLGSTHSNLCTSTFISYQTYKYQIKCYHQPYHFNLMHYDIHLCSAHIHANGSDLVSISFVY
jgi:hypothetical protein